MTTPYIDTPTPVSLDEPLADLIAVLAFERGIAPRCAEVEPGQCEWCAEVGAITTVRVYGQPRDDIAHPVELVEVCGMCAPSVIRRAVAEARDTASDIVVEVAA